MRIGGLRLARLAVWLNNEPPRTETVWWPLWASGFTYIISLGSHEPWEGLTCVV